jgi:hypothetical protein
MATVTSWVTKLRNRLGDSSTTGPFTTARLEDFCNDGLKDIARRLRPWLLPELNVVDTGDVTTNSSEYKCYVSLTTDFSQIVSMSVYTSNATNEEEEIVLVQDGYSYKQRRKRNVFWRPDSKQWFGYMENQRIYIEPYRNSNFKYRLRYVKTPEFTIGVTDIPINDRWEDMLLDYGEGRARKLEHRDQESELAFQRYEQMIQQANGGVEIESP